MPKLLYRIVSFTPLQTLRREVSQPESLYMNADPRNSLKELACRASRYSINLDGRVTIDMNFVLRGAYAFVRQGTLHPGKTKVAVKTARGGPPGDLETIKVHAPLTTRHICYSTFSCRFSCSVPSKKFMCCPNSVTGMFFHYSELLPSSI